MAYSPVTKAAIDATDEFIETLDAAWADIDESFHFHEEDGDDPNVVEVETRDKSSLTNETICSLNSFKHVPKDVHIKNVMDIVSPLAESHRVNRGKEMSQRDDFKVVRNELKKLKKEIEILGNEGNLSEMSDKETVAARMNGDIQHDTVCNTCKERSSKGLVEKGVNTSDENTPPSNNNIESSHEATIIKTENINLQKKIDQLEKELSQAFEKNESLEKELCETKSKTIQMEKTWLESKAKQDEMKDSYCNRIKELIQQSHHSQQQVKLAEEDANMALKLATESDTKRHEMELVLETVVKELELVKGCHFEESELNGSSPPKNEGIWKTIGGEDLESVLDESDASSSAFSLEPLDTPHSLENESVRKDQNCNLPNSFDSDIHESIMRVHNIVRTSGMQLNLPGKWFSKSMLSGADVDTETISKSYCMLVENLIRQQRDELNELKEFCSYLESKLVG